jgi:plastocyanin
MGSRLRALSLLGLAAFAAPAAAAETIRINVDQLTFTPARVSAHLGDTIEWVSTDFIAHTATARTKAWDVAIPAKGTGRITLKRAGDVEYYCHFHPNMVGRISASVRGEERRGQLPSSRVGPLTLRPMRGNTRPLCR